MEKLIPIDIIQQKIFMLRGHKVMLSIDLADLYKVEPKVLNQAVKRNIDRFPSDFMFQLTNQVGAAYDVQIHMHLQNRELLCFQQFYAASVL